MKASIIIPTYNGADKLPALLRSLERQNDPDFEIILVIDGSTDHTKDLFKNSSYTFQKLKIVTQPNKGRAAARNKGAQESETELLIFFDDDVELLVDVVERHKKHHAEIPGSILFGKVTVDTRRETFNDFYGYRSTIEEKWDRIFEKGLNVISSEKYGFTSANLSLSKNTFNALHGFDERLTDSEDFDFAMRALRENISIYYNPNIFAWHLDFIGIKGYIQRQKAYKHSKVYLLGIHPEYYVSHPLIFTISQKRNSPIKMLIARFFIYNAFWKFILESKFFRYMVPRKIRFKLYEMVIYSSTLHDN